jgi:hypothetical protein
MTGKFLFPSAPAPDIPNPSLQDLQMLLLRLRAQDAAERQAREQQEYANTRQRIPQSQQAPVYDYAPQPEPPAPRKDTDFLYSGGMSAFQTVFGGRSGVIGGSGVYSAKYVIRHEI